jgi:hypothetical protein
MTEMTRMIGGAHWINQNLNQLYATVQYELHAFACGWLGAQPALARSGRTRSGHHKPFFLCRRCPHVGWLARQGRVLIPRGRHSIATRNPHSAVGPRVINPNQLRRRLPCLLTPGTDTRAMWTRDIDDETCKMGLTSEPPSAYCYSLSPAVLYVGIMRG